MTPFVSRQYRQIAFAIAGSIATLASAICTASAAPAAARIAAIASPHGVSPRANPNTQDVYAFMVNGVAYPWAPEPLAYYEGYGRGMIGAWYWLSGGYYQNYTLWRWLPGKGQADEPYPWQCNQQLPKPWKGVGQPHYFVEVLDQPVSGSPVDLLSAINEQTTLVASGLDDVTIWRTDTPQPKICFKP